MTANILLDWLDNHFVPEPRQHCISKILDFKVVLIMDSAPDHAHFLVGQDSAVQVVLLLANTTSLIQPTDQEVISNTKLLLYQQLPNKMRPETDNLKELQAIQQLDCDSNSDRDSTPVIRVPSSASVISVKQFWWNFYIR